MSQEDKDFQDYSGILRHLVMVKIRYSKSLKIYLSIVDFYYYYHYAEINRISKYAQVMRFFKSPSTDS